MKTAEQSALKDGQRQWTCPYCRRRLAARSKEDTDQFAERCGAHRRGKHCPATARSHQLFRSGLKRLIDRTGAFLPSHGALKEVGLIEEHRTRLVEPDSARSEPWAQGWAIAYDGHLREQHRPFLERVAELRAAAASPEAEERVRVFLAFVATGR